MDKHQRVADVITEDILPALRMDGVGVEVVSVDTGVVRVRLTGVCGACPTSVHAVLIGIEEQLRRGVPGVEHLVVVP